MNFPIPYKQAEYLCENAQETIKIEAKCLMSAEFLQISPHADLEVLTKVH